MRSMKMCLAALVGAFAAVAWADVEYFVDAENGNDGYDGSSSTFVSGSVGPMKTVGAAVARANADGEPSIVTLLPGRYDEGEYYADGMTNRIVITEPHLKIRSTGGKENTFIIGNRDPSNSNGIGPAAVRGIYIKDDLMGMGGSNADIQATNVVIEGVTICNCATVSGKHGGAVYCLTPDGGGASLLIDCVVSNCSAGSMGGALYRQNAYRTLFVDNYAGQTGSAMAFGSMACCVIARNRGTSTTHNMRRAVNCTFANNVNYAFFGGYEMYCYNCLSFGNGGNGDSPSSNHHTYFRDCVSSLPTYLYPGRLDANSITNATLLQCVSTAFFDWRLLVDSPAVGKGQGKWFAEKALKLPPGYTFHDFLGNPINTSGTVDCGAVQTAAFTPGSGRIEFVSPFRMDGYEAVAVNKTYHYPTNAMAACRIRSVPASGTPYMVYWDAPGGSTVNMVPQYDGWTRILPPIETDVAITARTYTATQVLYVDKTIGNNSYDGSSAEVKSESVGPKKTLQAAADAVTDDFAIIYVAPGVYDEDTKTYTESDYTSASRLHTKKSTGFIAAQGPGTATIKGAPDPDTGGLGPAAIRCFFASTRSYLQGFVLQDGYTLNVSSTAGRGGAMYCGNASTEIACLSDCIVTNCHSYLGVTFYGCAWRTKFFDNHAHGEEPFRYTRFGSCLFSGTTAGSGYAMFRAACQLWGCTIDKLDADMKLHYENTVDGAFCGNLVATGLNSPVPAASGNVLTASPLFADRSAHDYRLCAHSPAIGAFQREDFYTKGVNYWAPADINGDDYIWVGGTTSAGAVQNKPIATYIVESVGGGVTVTGGSIGTNLVTETAMVTVTASDATARPFVGFEVDGLMLPAAQTSYSFTVSPEQETAPCVRALYGTTWYVDCAGGSDANSGGTLATAKKTICAATTNAAANDVVLVAPGTYGASEGAQQHSTHINKDNTATPVTIGARVLVPQNVTVRSIEGPEKTVIMGGAATSGADGWGRGEGAVRCATLMGVGARLEGFTLTGGRTTNGSAAHDDNIAGGVLSASGGIASNCIITNNVAMRSGAVFRGTLIDCRIFDNKATTQASVGRESSFCRCIIDRNQGGEQAIQWFSTINGCTIGKDNVDMSGAAQVVIAYRNGSSASVVNSIVLGSAIARNGEPYLIKNCAFMTGRVPNPASLPLTDCVVTNVEMLALDEDYRPVVGSNAAIDRGDTTSISSSINDGMDLGGGPRITNGAMDIGALEANWLPTYSAYVGGPSGRLSVTNASSAVRADSSRQVHLPSGAIEGVVNVAGALSSKFNVVFRVTGNGAFRIYLDGVLQGTYGYSADVQTVEFSRPENDFGLKLEYVPGEGDEGEAVVLKARMTPAGTVIMLK